jgi:hypothetical protein
MAVNATSPVSELLKDANVQNLIKKYTEGNGMAEDIGLSGLGTGFVGGIIANALGLNGNNRHGNNDYHDSNNRGATVSEVQGVVNGINTIQDIGAVRRDVAGVSKDVWQAEAAVQRDIAATKDALAQATTSNAVANLVGQGDIKLAIAESTYELSDEISSNSSHLTTAVNASGANILATVNVLATSLNQNINALNTNLLQGNNALTIVAMNEGDKTRAAVLASERGNS